MCKLTEEWVERWEKRYGEGMPEDEEELFDHTGRQIRRQGWASKSDVKKIAAWKSARNSYIDRNSDADVCEVTTFAFMAPVDLQHRILTLLSGVRRPTATAILAVADPESHTIMDWRSEDALVKLGQIGKGHTYPQYREVLLAHFTSYWMFPTLTRSRVVEMAQARNAL